MFLIPLNFFAVNLSLGGLTWGSSFKKVIILVFFNRMWGEG
jgi:hypothetical protein